MKQEQEKRKSARKQSKGDRGGEMRSWIKVGGAGPSHFLRLKITTILLLLLY